MIACSRLFRGLDPKLVSTLAAHASVLQLAHGDTLWREGQPAEHFNVVTRGVLELQRSSGSDTTLVALFGPGESPGVPVALERARYIATSYAITPTVDLLRVSAHAVLAALPREPSLALALNRGLLEHCRLLHTKIDVLTTGTVPRRLAALMLNLAERFGDEMADGSTFIPLPLSRGQIATYIGVRVETVIRCCTGWARTGILNTTADGFCIRELAIMEAIVRGDVRPLRDCRSSCDCNGPCEGRTTARRVPTTGRLD
jgi:CRP-like cAMP-binding protein